MAKAPRGAAAEHRVTLPPDLRIGSVRPTWEALAAVPARATVVIDASSVAKVDASGLQLLAAALVRLRASGSAWRWREASGVLRSAAHLAGLSSDLELEAP